jgi:hypothetical protein
MKLRVIALLTLLAITSAVKAQDSVRCQADPPRSLPGLWTYYWYSLDQAGHHKPSCFIQNGRRVYFTAITANSHKQPAADAKLVGEARPLPLPDEWYYWFSADQAGDQSPADQNCVSIDGKLRRYTEATLSNHPDGKAKDYVYVGKGNRHTEVTGAACVNATKRTE